MEHCGFVSFSLLPLVFVVPLGKERKKKTKVAMLTHLSVGRQDSS
jgi:hypothetical protein